MPPHKNYTESVYLVSEAGVLLHTNLSCQLSEAPQNLSQGVLGLPLPSWQQISLEDSTTYMAKARQTRVTARRREELLAAHRTECRERAITRTQDFPISEEDYQTLQEGGVVTVRKATGASTRGCQEAYQCTSPGPHACGYTGWINPAAPACCHQVPIPGDCSPAPLEACGFTFHQVTNAVNCNLVQVSTGTVCVTCKLNVTGPIDFCNPDRCWCHEITDKEKLMDCGEKTMIKNYEYLRTYYFQLSSWIQLLAWTSKTQREKSSPRR